MNKKQQYRFHFVTKNIFKSYFESIKKIDAQFINLSYSENEFKFKKWNNKKNLGIDDINCIDITESLEKWNANQLYLFNEFEKRLSEIETHFYNNFLKEYFDKGTELLKINNKPDLLGVKTNVTDAIDYYKDVANNRVGYFKDFSFAKFILYLEYQKTICMWYINEGKNLDFFEIIKILRYLIGMSNNIENNEWKKLKENLKKVKNLKINNIMELHSTENDVNSVETAISTNFISSLPIEDFKEMIISFPINLKRFCVISFSKDGSLTQFPIDFFSSFLKIREVDKPVNIFLLNNFKTYFEKGEKHFSIFIQEKTWLKFKDMKKIKTKKGYNPSYKDGRETNIIWEILSMEVIFNKDNLGVEKKQFDIFDRIERGRNLK